MESLISLSLFLLIVVSSLEFLSLSRSYFYKIKQSQEDNETSFSALEKIKTDMAEAGLGLFIPIGLEALKGITTEENLLSSYSKEKDLSSFSDLCPGQTRIDIPDLKDIKKGKLLCLFNSEQAEVTSIHSVANQSILVSPPIQNFYASGHYTMVLLKKVSFYFDSKTQIIRRKVNSSPSQPLLEEVEAFHFNYNKESNLLHVGLEIKSDREKNYEISLFPKNLALAAAY